MYSVDTKIRVRYNETDRMGYLHHSFYPVYFEIARTEMLRSIGSTYKLMEDSGIIMPVYSLNVEYKAPAFYDETLTVKSVMKELPVVRLIINYEILNENESIICTGTTTNVFVNAETRKPMRVPEDILSLFNKFVD